MGENNWMSMSFYDWYLELGVSAEILVPKSGIAIIDLKEVGFNLPYKSPVYISIALGIRITIQL